VLNRDLSGYTIRGESANFGQGNGLFLGVGAKSRSLAALGMTFDALFAKTVKIQ
jgi:hypothetical protein